MGERRAVKPAAGLDAELTVEDGREFGGVESVDADAEDADALVGGSRAVEFQSVDGGEAVDQLLHEGEFVATKLFDAAGLDPGECGVKSGNSGCVVAAGFEFVRSESGLDGAFAGGACSAFAKWGEAIDQRFANAEHAGAERTEQSLVSGQCEQVEGETVEIDREVARGLSGVEKEGYAGGATDAGDLLDGLHCAGDVAGVIDDHERRIVAQRSLEVAWIDACRIGMGAED